MSLFDKKKKKDTKILDFSGNNVSCCGNRNDIYTSTAIKISQKYIIGYVYVLLMLIIQN